MEMFDMLSGEFEELHCVLCDAVIDVMDVEDAGYKVCAFCIGQ